MKHMTRILGIILAALLTLTLGAGPAEAKGKHKGWTHVTVCTAEGQPPLIFPGSAGLVACPGGYYDATVLKVRTRPGSLR